MHLISRHCILYQIIYNVMYHVIPLTRYLLMLIYTLVIYTHWGEKLGFTKAALNTDVLYTNPHPLSRVCLCTLQPQV